ncbi:type II toxin-antitoxin system YoeB family toxin [Flavobacterium galactosidilyticum]|mgnify:CR=1 FL=1|uniref:type II toxin-antitoxin system YoeB family toxin n=1 Tax=Flavobacterium galactosidilyticum TaxID=2893886 RepID=UPI001E57A610|nr:type II toxin-antitoxin system YoeB family toxin [Flavobacterium sp. F-340]UFH45137.1 type II toxin-antitoxin system YoeB family toxin [Flavobacterium sp. F-340]
MKLKNTIAKTRNKNNDKDSTWFWSQRIDDEYRLIYKFLDDEIQILKARHHYD